MWINATTAPEANKENSAIDADVRSLSNFPDQTCTKNGKTMA
jgi:hypothetical protein